MGTHRIAASVRIDRPAAQVAAVVLDWSHDVRWRAAVTRFTVDPGGRAVVGQRLVEELRFAGLTFTTPTTVVEVEPLFAGYVGGNGSFAVTGSRHVDPVGAGACEVRTEVLLTPRGVMRVVAPVLVPSYRRSDAADLLRLKSLVLRPALLE